MLHRVLPTYRERYCLTVWLDGDDGVNSEDDIRVRGCGGVCERVPDLFDRIAIIPHHHTQLRCISSKLAPGSFDRISS